MKTGWKTARPFYLRWTPWATRSAFIWICSRFESIWHKNLAYSKKKRLGHEWPCFFSPFFCSPAFSGLQTTRLTKNQELAGLICVAMERRPWLLPAVPKLWIRSLLKNDIWGAIEPSPDVKLCNFCHCRYLGGTMVMLRWSHWHCRKGPQFWVLDLEGSGTEQISRSILKDHEFQEAANQQLDLHLVELGSHQPWLLLPKTWWFPTFSAGPSWGPTHFDESWHQTSQTLCFSYSSALKREAEHGSNHREVSLGTKKSASTAQERSGSGFRRPRAARGWGRCCCCWFISPYWKMSSSLFWWLFHPFASVCHVFHIFPFCTLQAKQDARKPRMAFPLASLDGKPACQTKRLKIGSWPGRQLWRIASPHEKMPRNRRRCRRPAPRARPRPRRMNSPGRWSIRTTPSSSPRWETRWDLRGKCVAQKNDWKGELWSGWWNAINRNESASQHVWDTPCHLPLRHPGIWTKTSRRWNIIKPGMPNLWAPGTGTFEVPRVMWRPSSSKVPVKIAVPPLTPRRRENMENQLQSHRET